MNTLPTVPTVPTIPAIPGMQSSKFAVNFNTDSFTKIEKMLLTIGLIAVLFSIILWVYHKTPGYDGAYEESNVYENISALKHDLFKQFTVDLIPILLLGAVSGDAFIKYKLENGKEAFDWAKSRIIGMIASLLGYVVFYEFVQPMVNYLPYF